ncbi:hypothetical protein DSL92_08465 [Billgrantia gudaonensis]|uniref:Uncharacterized protein n=1 Tax=Billgrantia gudaonensis TaxID=376427 RepID=A0A3S0Q0T2_9GAMM|nr:hypothetical protein DSL92_08465 [Halomonas gudaonensis]
MSGLNAQKDKLGAIGNIPTPQTVGFRAPTCSSPIFANSRVGLGTKVSSVLQNFSEGNVGIHQPQPSTWSRPAGLLPLPGEGGEVLYSRNGQLSTDLRWRPGELPGCPDHGLRAQCGWCSADRRPAEPLNG